MFKVRFHLGRGPYYKYWQIIDLEDKDAGPKYINPETSQLVLLDCELVCNEEKAKKIYAAGRKDVCGWIKCSHLHWHDLFVSNPVSIDSLERIMFNPIVDPVWRSSKDPTLNMNNVKFDKLITKGNKVYVHDHTYARMI